jgi:hypothetical protein
LPDPADAWRFVLVCRSCRHIIDRGYGQEWPAGRPALCWACGDHHYRGFWGRAFAIASPVYLVKIGRQTRRGGDWEVKECER